jgi:hypothetical protein
MGMQNYCDITLVYGFCVVTDLFVSWESIEIGIGLIDWPTVLND